MTEELEEADLVVIGAGIYGLQAARTYLEVHPRRRVVVLEASASVGGVWSAERMYDAFYTQTPLGMLEFSDQTMHNVPNTDTSYGFFSAHHVTQYLEDYVCSHVYDGVTLSQRILFKSPVDTLVKLDDGWMIGVTSKGLTIGAPHVIDATGLTSIPNIPDVAENPIFKGSVLHHKDFGQSGVLEDNAIHDVVVLGGAKSAADVAYAAVKANKNVSWVIRMSGSGPAAFVAAEGNGAYRNSNESFYTRITGYFLASFFVNDNRLTRFLYQTSLGRYLFARLWKTINVKSSRLADYDRKEGEGNGFQNLRPDTEIFWTNESPSINQREDFFDTIATHAHVYRQDISHMTEKGVVLKDGTLLLADAIIFATGWKPNHPHIDTQLCGKLGLPIDLEHDRNDVERWAKLMQEAEYHISERFPMLQHPPAYRRSTPKTTPFLLYLSMIPVHDHSILFLGKMMLGNHFRNAEVQALFAVAVLDGNVKLPTADEMDLQIARTLAWCKLRYLAKGQLGSWFYFDMVPYTDALLTQLGLVSHRKGVWKDLFETCFARDLRGLIGEYKNKYGTK